MSPVHILQYRLLNICLGMRYGFNVLGSKSFICREYDNLAPNVRRVNEKAISYLTIRLFEDPRVKNTSMRDLFLVILPVASLVNYLSSSGGGVQEILRAETQIHQDVE